MATLRLLLNVSGQLVAIVARCSLDSRPGLMIAKCTEAIFAARRSKIIGRPFVGISRFALRAVEIASHGGWTWLGRLQF